MPADATVTFSIPSVHDDTLLECRVYVPPPSILPHKSSNWPRRVRGAIIAHPYASFGGCFDDQVVLALVTELLCQHFVVGTFNFRGAGASKGRTSWTSKPETYDYISFVGFFFHYLHALRLPHRGEPTLSSLTAPLTPIPTGVTLERHSGEVQPHLTLILSGYSYGSLITTYLPPIETILERFAQVKPGTSEAEIRLRASSLASQWNQEAQMHIDMLNERGLKAPSMRRTSPNPTALAMGGEESEPGTRRLSQESRRSRDLVRKSFERSHIHFGRRISAEENKHSVESAHRVLPYTLVAPRICYLLISPLLPPVASLATFFTHASHTRSTKSSISAAGDIDHRLASHPTLVIYGGRDFFISQKKLRAWAQPIFKRPSSLFRFHEIAGAGHFWHESSAEADMRRFVREWVGKIE